MFDGIDYVNSVQNLDNLTYLDLSLSNVSLNENGCSVLAQCLSKILNLKTLFLDLSNNQIAFTGAIQVFKALSELRNLHTLDLNLYNNDISHPLNPTLLESIISKEKLEINDPLKFLLMCKSSTENRNFKNLSELKVNLKKNNLGTEVFKIFSHQVPKLKNLKSMWLDLKWNIINVDGAKALALALGKFSNLNKLYLNLECCKIGNEGASALLNETLQLRELNSLILNFECNKIGLEIKDVLTKSLEEYVNKMKIMNINLYNNYISEENVKSLKLEINNF